LLDLQQCILGKIKVIFLLSLCQVLRLIFPDTAVKVAPIKASSVEETIQEIEKNLKTTFTKQILLTEREPSACQEDCPTVRWPKMH